MTRRCLRGDERLHEPDRAVALEDPVGADREHEEDPDEDLERRLRHRERRVEELAPDGSCRSRLSIPARISCLIPVECVASGGCVEADRLLHLVDRTRHDEPEEERDQPGERRGSG